MPGSDGGWYYGGGAEEKGPVEEQAIRDLISAGEIGPATPLRRDGWSHRQTARCCEFSSLFLRESPHLSTLAVTLLQSGAERALFYLADIPLMIGRAEDCDISMPDPSLAAHHARFTLAGDTVYIEDLGNPEGTEVNSQPVVSTRPLNSGDSLRLGGWHADLRIETAAFRPPPPTAGEPAAAARPPHAGRGLAARVLAACAALAIAAAAAVFVRLRTAAQPQAPLPQAPPVPFAPPAGEWPLRAEEPYGEGFNAGEAAGREWVSRSTFADLREIPGTDTILRSLRHCATNPGAVYGEQWTNGFVSGFRTAHGRAPKRFEEFTGTGFDRQAGSATAGGASGREQ